jgi:hypothetical protein
VKVLVLKSDVLTLGVPDEEGNLVLLRLAADAPLAAVMPRPGSTLHFFPNAAQ